MYEVCLIRIKEQFVEKRSTVGTHRDSDCMLKNTHVVNKKRLEHLDDISFKELFGRIRVILFFTNIRYLYLRWPLFFMKHSLLAINILYMICIIWLIFMIS